VQLDAEVAVVERGLARPVARISEGQGNVVAEEVGARDAPPASILSVDRE